MRWKHLIDPHLCRHHVIMCFCHFFCCQSLYFCSQYFLVHNSRLSQNMKARLFACNLIKTPKIPTVIICSHYDAELRNLLSKLHSVPLLTEYPASASKSYQFDLDFPNWCEKNAFTIVKLEKLIHCYTHSEAGPWKFTSKKTDLSQSDLSSAMDVFLTPLYFWRVEFQSQTAMKFLPQISRLDHARSATTYMILYTTGIRIGKVHCAIITAGLKTCKVHRPLDDQTHLPCTPQVRFGAALSKQHVWPRSSGFSSTLVKWLSSRTYAQVPSGRFSSVWIASRHPPVLHIHLNSSVPRLEFQHRQCPLRFIFIIAIVFLSYLFRRKIPKAIWCFICSKDQVSKATGTTALVLENSWKATTGTVSNLFQCWGFKHLDPLLYGSHKLFNNVILWK